MRSVTMKRMIGRSRSADRGFTLVELLVALVLYEMAPLWRAIRLSLGI